MREQGAAERRGPTGHNHGDAPCQIDSLEIIVARFRHAQAVAHEGERGVNLPGGEHAQVDDRGVTKRDRLLPAVAHDHEARLLLDELPRLERDRLEVPAGSAGLQSRRLERRRDVLSRLAVPRASGVAPFQRIVGQKLHVRPPALRGSRGVGHRRSDERGEQEDERQAAHRHSTTQGGNGSSRAPDLWIIGAVAEGIAKARGTFPLRVDTRGRQVDADQLEDENASP